MALAAVGLFFLVIFGAMIAGLVFWIMKIVEVAGIPEPQYRAAGTDKTVWVLVVVLVGWVGALIWQFAKREDVLRARGLVPPPGFGPAPYWGPVQGPGYGQQQLPGPGPGYGPYVGAPYNPGWGQPLPTAPLADPYAPVPAGSTGPVVGPPAPGWYPEADSSWSAYWDGYRWTGARRPPEEQSARPNLQKHPD